MPRASVKARASERREDPRPRAEQRAPHAAHEGVLLVEGGEQHVLREGLALRGERRRPHSIGRPQRARRALALRTPLPRELGVRRGRERRGHDVAVRDERDVQPGDGAQAEQRLLVDAGAGDHHAVDRFLEHHGSRHDLVDGGGAPLRHEPDAPGPRLALGPDRRAAARVHGLLVEREGREVLPGAQRIRGAVEQAPVRGEQHEDVAALGEGERGQERAQAQVRVRGDRGGGIAPPEAEVEARRQRRGGEDGAELGVPARQGVDLVGDEALAQAGELAERRARLLEALREALVGALARDALEGEERGPHGERDERREREEELGCEAARTLHCSASLPGRG